ncbi:MAG: hypothetical protein IBX56_01445 [Methylomicrobium sp.]|nr:hypothetical protein [Methylomicrobium sp.]
MIRRDEADVFFLAGYEAVRFFWGFVGRSGLADCRSAPNTPYDHRSRADRPGGFNRTKPTR